VGSQTNRQHRAADQQRLPAAAQPPPPLQAGLAHPHRLAAAAILRLLRRFVGLQIRIERLIGQRLITIARPLHERAVPVSAATVERSSVSSFSPSPETLPAPWVRMRSPGRAAAAAAVSAASALGA